MTCLFDHEALQRVCYNTAHSVRCFVTSVMDCNMTSGQRQQYKHVDDVRRRQGIVDEACCNSSHGKLANGPSGTEGSERDTVHHMSNG